MRLRSGQDHPASRIPTAVVTCSAVGSFEHGGRREEADVDVAEAAETVRSGE